MDKKSVIVISMLVGVLILVFAFGIVSLKKISEEEKEANKINEVEIVKNVEADITFDEEKINVYLFFGEGCSHCKALKYYLNNLDSKYKKMFKLYTFEVWGNMNNQVLMNKFGDELEVEIDGVPFLVIGDVSFSGYSTSLNEDILDEIINNYESEEKVDIYKNIKK